MRRTHPRLHEHQTPELSPQLEPGSPKPAHFALHSDGSNRAAIGLGEPHRQSRPCPRPVIFTLINANGAELEHRPGGRRARCSIVAGCLRRAPRQGFHSLQLIVRRSFIDIHWDHFDREAGSELSPRFTKRRTMCSALICH